MTKIILTPGCLGKTYLDKTNSKVYDFDKHLLSYKYNREDFFELTDEGFLFKSINSRTWTSRINWKNKGLNEGDI